MNPAGGSEAEDPSAAGPAFGALPAAAGVPQAEGPSLASAAASEAFRSGGGGVFEALPCEGGAVPGALPAAAGLPQAEGPSASAAPAGATASAASGPPDRLGSSGRFTPSTQEVTGASIHLHWRPFSFPLPAPLRTAAGILAQRRGWLLRLETRWGGLGWGEASPLGFGGALEASLERCRLALRELGGAWLRDDLERRLPSLPLPLAFALGAALAEADGLVGDAAGGWRPAPPSAWLLPAGAAALTVARSLLAAPSAEPIPPENAQPPIPLTVKWKVGVYGEEEERAWYGQLAALLPPDSRLRLDANGGFRRATAWRWADHLRGDNRLDWLEQPLAPADQEGLEALARVVPVALDESLLRDPELRRRWPGWQVRRPSQEGDPRPLLRALEEGRPRWMVSTSFETGLGQHWLAHLSALQAEGPTPVAPGLAPGWRAPGGLGAEAPETVWRAAGGGGNGHHGCAPFAPGASGVPRLEGGRQVYREWADQ